MTKHREQETSPETFVDIIQRKYDCEDTLSLYHGIGRCSEERILFFLKKIKPIDMAIIFHSWPTFVFVPGFSRDVAKLKIADDEIEFLHKSREGSFWIYPDFEKQIPISTDQFEGRPLNEALALLHDNRKYFYHPDLQMNRFTGALVQIDQYCTSKKIPVIHFVNNALPSWFEFTSGIVDTKIVEMSYIKSPYYVGYEKSENAINTEGNNLIAEKIIHYIENYETLHIALD